MDANPLVGSSGLNASRVGLERINSTNQLITGNVTGLGGFRGNSPVQDPSLFRAGLGSSGLTFFNRQAVSYGDVISNRTAAGQTYFGREETIIGIGGIQAGVNQQGSSLPQSRFDPATPGLLTRRLENPTLATTIEQWQAAGRALQVPPIDLSRAAAEAADSARPWRSRTSLFTAAADSSLFGAARFEEAQIGAMPLTFDPTRFDYRRPDVEQTTDAAAAAVSTLERTLNPGAAEAAAARTAAGESRSVFSGLATALREASPVDKADIARESRARLLSQAARTDADALRGMMARARTRIPADAPSPETQRQRAMEEAERLARTQRAIVEDAVGSFAAPASDPFNDAMQSGEKAMREARYYSAADLFRAASQLQPADPLPVAAVGHALLAAGDYRAAAEQIKTAVQMFPNIAMLNLDLRKLIGDSAVLDARLADLHRAVSRAPQPDLQFLLGYTNYYGGKRDLGLKSLIQAALAAPEDDVISSFPLLLAGDALESP